MTTAIIVAAGQGTRMATPADKLFLELHGLPVVGHTWLRFDRHPEIDEVVMVIREGREAEFEALAKRLALCRPWRLAFGGKERQDSVWAGVSAVSAAVEWIAIQDAARPCTSPQAISAVLEGARATGAAVLGTPVVDTLKESADGALISRHVDRSKMWAVQTPQVFRAALIRRALEESRRRGWSLTDDTAACEAIGQPVRLIRCDEPNPKLTVPGDAAYLEWCLRSASRKQDS